MKRAERKLWKTARTLADLGELMAQWLEGDLRSRPGYYGPTDLDSTELTALCVDLCRAGVVTFESQGAQTWEDDYAGVGRARVFIEAFVGDEHLGGLRDVCRDAGLTLIAHRTPPRRWFGSFRSTGADEIPVVLHGERTALSVGSPIDRRYVDLMWDGVSDEAYDAVAAAWQVTIIDPEWGRNDRLRLALDMWTRRDDTRQLPVPIREEAAGAVPGMPSRNRGGMGSIRPRDDADLEKWVIELHEGGHAAIGVKEGFSMESAQVWFHSQRASETPGYRGMRLANEPVTEFGGRGLVVGERVISDDQIDGHIITALSGPAAEARAKHMFEGGSLRAQREQAYRHSRNGDMRNIAEVIRQASFSLCEGKQTAEQLVDEHWAAIQRVARELRRHRALNGRRIGAAAR